MTNIRQTMHKIGRYLSQIIRHSPLGIGFWELVIQE